MRDRCVQAKVLLREKDDDSVEKEGSFWIKKKK